MLNPEEILYSRISLTDKRYPTFLHPLKAMAERKVTTIIETGTARNGEKNCTGDGCSTVI